MGPYQLTPKSKLLDLDDFSNPPVQWIRSVISWAPQGYGKSELTVEKKRRALSEGAERRELLTDYSTLDLMDLRGSRCGFSCFFFEGFVCFFKCFFRCVVILCFCCRFLVGKMIFSCLIPDLFQGTCNSLTCNVFPKILSWKSMQKTQDAIDEGPNVGNLYNKFPHGKGCIPTGIPNVKDMGISIRDTTFVQRR